MTSENAQDLNDPAEGMAVCPEHGDTLRYHDYQGDEMEWREHLECKTAGCEYEAWI